MKYILNGLMALALVLMFTQCADNKSNGSTNNAPAAVSGPANMKIAYVEIDSLLTKYRFWNDLNEMMIKKEENIRTTLNEKARELDSINSFLKIYNKDKGYSLIISNTGFDNLLYADPAFNITNEIVEGLNARYVPASKK